MVWVRQNSVRTDPDHATVAEQIVPYLSTHKTPKALREHLGELIGTTPEATALTETFVAAQFPQGDAPHRRDTRPVRVTPSTVAAALAESEAASERRALPPTLEMKQLDAAFAMLSTEPSSTAAAMHAPTTRRLCLCEGQRHALAKYAPLCVACGLVLCAALSPPPVSPHSMCPSCSASPIIPTLTRTRLLGELVETRERLEREQLAQEAQRQAERAALRAQGGETDMAFPTLGGAPAPAPAPPKQRSRVLHLDMKTHQVSVSRPKAKPRATEMSATARPAQDPTALLATAEDGSQLVHDYDDDGFRRRFGRSTAPKHELTLSWGAMAALQPHSATYIPPEARDVPLEPVRSERLTDVPELDEILQRNPPGSAPDPQRSRSSASAAAIARSQGRKTGKPGRKR